MAGFGVQANGKENGAPIHRVHLIGQTEWSVAALIQAALVSETGGRSQLDVPLTALGRDEFSAVAGQLEAQKLIIGVGPSAGVVSEDRGPANAMAPAAKSQVALDCFMQ